MFNNATQISMHTLIREYSIIQKQGGKHPASNAAFELNANTEP